MKQATSACHLLKTPAPRNQRQNDAHAQHYQISCVHHNHVGGSLGTFITVAGVQDAEGDLGNRPLHLAAAQGQWAVCRLLLSRGASVVRVQSWDAAKSMVCMLLV